VRNTDGQYPYKLKSGVHFHLYINTAPCGDARIFSPHENDTGVDKHPNRLVQKTFYKYLILLKLKINTSYTYIHFKIVLFN